MSVLERAILVPMLPHSDACERNKGPILEVLREAFADCKHVLEIGSGTGQHAVHFATRDALARLAAERARG